MAKGLEKHKERQNALSLFGKELTRRSGSKCELCSDSGVSLRVYEVPKAPIEPDFERCIYICDVCRDQLQRPKKLDTNHWRCAVESVWSEVAAVQVVSARILDQLSKTELWAREALEHVELEEEIEAWVSEESI